MRLEAGAGMLLRSFTDADAEPLFALVDANRRYLRQWLPWLDLVRGIDDIRGFIAGVTERERAGTSLELAIEHGGKLCGVAGYRSLDLANRSAEVGYWLRADYQGRGLMSAACRVLIDHGFERLGLNRVALLAAVGNARSRRLAERLGFSLEGELREYEWLYDHFVDVAVYSLLRRDKAG